MDTSPKTLVVLLLGLQITAVWFLVVQPELVFLPQLSRSFSQQQLLLLSSPASGNDRESVLNLYETHLTLIDNLNQPTKLVDEPERRRENQKDEEPLVVSDKPTLSDPLSRSVTTAFLLASLLEADDRKVDQGEQDAREKPNDQEIEKTTGLEVSSETLVEVVIKDPSQDLGVPGLPIVLQRHVLVTL